MYLTQYDRLLKFVLMKRFYKIPFWAFLMGLMFFGILVFLSLPVVLVLFAVFVLTGALRSLLMGKRVRSRNSQSETTYQSNGVSPVIENNKIGPYRIRKTPSDPTIIEVLD